jgi:hypothetical protein
LPAGVPECPYVFLVSHIDPPGTSPDPILAGFHAAANAFRFAWIPLSALSDVFLPLC